MSILSLKMNGVANAVLVALLMLAPGAVRGTVQFPDCVIIEGDTLDLRTFPLQPILKQNPERFAFLTDSVSCTACWRGYIAYWEIRSDSLWLLGVNKMIGCTEQREIPIDLFFPGHSGPVFAAWYTGGLIIPEGEPLENTPTVFGAQVERDRLLFLKNGAVTDEAVLDNRQPPPFRSHLDLLRCGPDHRIVDTGYWLDARLFGLHLAELDPQRRDTITTRGFLDYGGGSGFLRVPATRMTGEVVIPVADGSVGLDSCNWQCVAVDGILSTNGQTVTIRIIGHRVLRDNESIHALSFPFLYPFLMDSLRPPEDF